MAYRLTNLARDDLKEIFEYSFQHWGLAQASDYERELRRVFETIDDEPMTEAAILIWNKNFTSLSFPRKRESPYLPPEGDSRFRGNDKKLFGMNI